MHKAQLQWNEGVGAFRGLTTICRAVGALLLAAGVQAAGGQDPLKTLPKNYTLVFENDRVAVIRAHYGARETVPVHDHPSVATVFVYLNDSGPVRINHADGASTETVVRPPTVAGSYRVAPGLAERHSIENPGDTSSEFLRVELKGVTLKIKEPFRGKAPAGSLKDEDVVEFSDPAVRVERNVCVTAAPCAVKAEGSGSLMVVFGAVMDGRRTFSEGSVWWVPAGETPTVGKGVVVHLLRIVLL